MKIKGHFFILGTHIGSPLDIPPRSLEILRTADVVVFEEDKMARGFLKAAGIHRPYLTLSEHREKLTLEDVAEAFKAGKVVSYMSDQGMPSVADPGRDLLAIAQQYNAQITVIPGPSSLTAAIAACPFDCSRFFFLGLPPREEKPRQAFWQKHQTLSVPLVVFDAPYRLKALLESCIQALGKNRSAFLAIDISGPKETYWHGSLANLKNQAAALEEKLNFVLIIAA